MFALVQHLKVRLGMMGAVTVLSVRIGALRARLQAQRTELSHAFVRIQALATRKTARWTTSNIERADAAMYRAKQAGRGRALCAH